MIDWLLLAALSNPWQVGPAPSAHPTLPSWNVGVDVGAMRPLRSGLPGPHGGRLAAAFTPHERVWSSLELGLGQGWRTCIDCEALAATWTLRGLALHHRNVNVAPWSVLTSVHGTVEWTPGLAIEAGGRRVRVDTSWPLWSTWYLLTVLRSTPELGMTVAWDERQATRVAVVGLEPGVAVTHRVMMRRWALEATGRAGEEGVGVELGIRVWGLVPWR